MTTQHKRYAVKDGDYGLARICRADGSVHYHFYPVVRCVDTWMWLSAIKGADNLPLKEGDEITVFRLTGWGADGPTEKWVDGHIHEPIEATPGMRCAWWSHESCEPDLASDEWKQACCLSFVGVQSPGGRVAVEWDDGCEKTYPDTYMLRCAETGAPLKLPGVKDG